MAAQHGYAKGFDTYRETWQERALATEMDRTRAITEARRALPARGGRRRGRFFLWLHYVNPHAPYTPPRALRHGVPGRADARAGRGCRW